MPLTIQLAVVGTTQGDSAVLDVLPTDVTVDSAGSVVVDDIRTAVESSVGGDVGVTGVGASVEDYLTAGYDELPYVLILISVITFLLVVRTFRSLLLPIKAVLLNLVSLAAVFGSVVFFWQQGHGSDARSAMCPPPVPLTSGCQWSSSHSCSACRWTTRCSSSPA